MKLNGGIITSQGAFGYTNLRFLGEKKLATDSRNDHHPRESFALRGVRNRGKQLGRSLTLKRVSPPDLTACFERRRLWEQSPFV